VNLALFLAIAGLACAETKGLVYVSGRTGVDGGSGARAQTLRALRATRLNPKRILNTTVYVTDVKHIPDVDRAYRDFFRNEFPARTVLVAGLLAPGALVEISATATGRAIARRIIRPSEPESAAVEAAGTLYLSAMRPGEAAGATIEAQTEQVMKNQESVLQAAGFSFSDLVLSRIYLSEPSAYAGLNEIYRRFVTAPPPARATIHAHPAHPGELLQIQSIAVRGSGMGRPSGAGHTSPIHSFSVKAGRTLYVTGMTGRAPDGRFASEIRGQTRQALATIAEQLERHGLGFEDVVETTIWLRDRRDFEQMSAVYRSLVPRGADASTVVEIPPTATEALVEIQMIADSPKR